VHGRPIFLKSNQMWTSTSTIKTTEDPIVKSVILKYKERSRIGISKYGTNLMRDDYNLVDWLKEAQAEAMDFALYCEAAINKIERDGSKTA
jgi:hypothetical protein